MPSRILHVDMDAFFASIEQRDDPDLRGRPIAVAGRGPRGVIAAASYEARAAGVSSAMPVGKARRLCPDLQVVTPRMAEYEQASAQVMSLLRDASDLVEPVSLDEAFIDVTHSPADWQVIAEGIRADIRRELGLPASVGGGSTKTIAKLSSGAAKPDGVHLVALGDELGFLHALPVAKLWGVGPKTASVLDGMGVATVGDLAGRDRDELVGLFGQARGSALSALANNDDPRGVDTRESVASVGHRLTFDQDVGDVGRLEVELGALSRRVARRLRDGGFAARTLEVVVRSPTFQTRSKQRTMAVASAHAGVLSSVGCELLGPLLEGGGRLRMVGVVGSSLVPLDPSHLHGEPPDGGRWRWRPVDLIDHPIFGGGQVLECRDEFLVVRFVRMPAPVSLPLQDRTVQAGPDPLL